MTNEIKNKFQSAIEFAEKNSADRWASNGFATEELAIEYAKLRMDAWGSNLVFLGISESCGRFYPGFNVFD